MAYKVQVPTGRPADGNLCTVLTTMEDARSALTHGLRQTESQFTAENFRVDYHAGVGKTLKFVHTEDSRLCAYVTKLEDR